MDDRLGTGIMSEEFKVIKEFPDYEINREGIVRRIRDGFLLKLQNREYLPNNAPYYLFKSKERTIDRLLRDAFGKVPEGVCLSFIGFPNYIAVKSGDIYSMKTYKFLKKATNKDTGYYIVTLCNDSGHRIGESVHRLIALAFLPNPENKPQVNHIDGVKINNSVDNLEWCTVSENAIHAWNTGLKPLVLSTRSTDNDTIHTICKMICDNFTNAEIIRKTNASQSIVASMRHGDIYTDITSQYDFKTVDSSRRNIRTDVIKRICNELQDGNTLSDVSRSVGTSIATVHRIKHRKIHQHISKDYVW